jgi:ornithine cyclodeaminase/alanine dehydrogenase
MPAYLPKTNLMGLKWVSGYPENYKRGLPGIIGIVVLNEPATGKPLAVMDGTWITKMRTGAVTAVGAKYLAREDADTVGIIGAGVQGRSNLSALNEVLKIKKAKAFDVSRATLKKYADDMSKKFGFDVEAVESWEAAVKGSDVVVIAIWGPGEERIKMEWLKPGFFGAPVGGGWPRSFEDKMPLKIDKFLVDNWLQMLSLSEAFSSKAKQIGLNRETVPELGEVVVGKSPGRGNDEERIVCQCYGMATEDIALGTTIYERALKKGLGEKLQLI